MQPIFDNRQQQSANVDSSSQYDATWLQLQSLAKHSRPSQELSDFVMEFSALPLDKNGESFVHKAAKLPTGLPIVRNFVRKFGYECLLQQAKNKDTPMHLMAQHQGLEALAFVNKCLSSKLNYLEIKGYLGRLPIHYASMNQQTQLVMEWIVLAQDPQCLTVQDRNFTTPAAYAALHQGENSLQLMVNYLKAIGVEYHDLLAMNDQRLIHFAAMNKNSISALKWIVADLGEPCLTVVDGDDNTPIHLLAKFQNFAAIHFVCCEFKNFSYEHLTSGYDQLPVHFAAKNPKTDSVLRWMLSDLGYECLIKRDGDKVTPIHLAARYHDDVTMKRICEELEANKVDYEKLIDRWHRSIIHYSTMNSATITALKFLLSKVDQQLLRQSDRFGNLPVHYSAQYQQGDAVRYIASITGWDWVKQPGHKGKLAIHFAAMNANCDAVLQLLVERDGCNCLTLRDDEGNTAVHLSARYQTRRSFDSVKELLERSGIDYQQLANHQGQLPLHYAAMNEVDDSILRAIVDKLGPESLLIQDNNWNTPIHFIAQFQNEDTLQFVAEHQGTRWWSLKGWLDRRPIHFAAMNSANFSPLLWLVQHQGSACLTIEDVIGDTAVLLAAKFQNGRSLEFMKTKLDAMKLNYYGEKGMKKVPIHFAAKNSNSLSALKWLIEDNGIICLLDRDRHGNTPIHLAARYRDERTMRFLKKILWRERIHYYKIDGFRQQFPIHFAAMNQWNHEVLKWMVNDLGFQRLLIRNAKGDTPVHFIAMYQTPKAAEYVQNELKKYNKDCFAISGYKDRRLVHFAAKHKMNFDVLKWIVRHQKPQCLIIKDADGTTAAHLTARFQSGSAVEFVRKKLRKIDVDHGSIRNYHGQLPIHFAALNFNDTSALKLLVKSEGPRVLVAKCHKGVTPLHLVAKYQSTKVMRFVKTQLDAASIRCDQVLDNSGQQVAHVAASREMDNSMLHWVIKNFGKKSLTRQDNDGNVPLQTAVQHQNFKTVQHLLSMIGVSWKLIVDSQQRHLIHYAAMNKFDNKILKWMVQKLGQQSLLLKDKDDATPCHLAARYQDDDSMLYISSKLKTLRIEFHHLADVHQRLPAHYAAMNTTSCEPLLYLAETLGVSCLKVIDEFGATPAHYMAQYQNSATISKVMHYHLPSYFQFEDGQQRLPLHYAAKNIVTVTAFKFLLIDGEFDSLIAEARDGDSPIHVAARHQDAHMMAFIKEKLSTTNNDYSTIKGIDNRLTIHSSAMNLSTNSTFKFIVNDLGYTSLMLRDKNNKTPVHYAAEYQGINTMQFVRSYLGDDYSKLAGNNGEFPIHCAARNKDATVLQWMVMDRGTKCLGWADNSGNTAIDICCRKPTSPAVNFIKKKLNKESAGELVGGQKSTKEKKRIERMLKILEKYLGEEK